MQEHQRTQSVESTHCGTANPGANQAFELTTIVERRTKPAASPMHHLTKYEAATPPAPPLEKPSNPNPSQQPQYPGDPMDPSDPNSPNPIEGTRENLFPKDTSKQAKLNE